MEQVEPLRAKDKLEAMKKALKKDNIRNYVLLVLGINSGLRISDLLSLQIEDIADKDRVIIREQKTNKIKDFPLSDSCKKAINEYLAITGLTSGWLFPSKKGSGPITRIQAYRIINSAARQVGITENIGTHTLRKTFGYWAYKQGVDIIKIQKLLNHSAPSVTLAYIGITKEDLDNVYLNLDL